MTVTHVGTSKKYAANWAVAFGKSAGTIQGGKAAAKPVGAATKKKTSKKSKRGKSKQVAP